MRSICPEFSSSIACRFGWCPYRLAASSSYSVLSTAAASSAVCCPPVQRVQQGRGGGQGAQHRGSLLCSLLAPCAIGTARGGASDSPAMILRACFHITISPWGDTSLPSDGTAPSCARSTLPTRAARFHMQAGCRGNALPQIEFSSPIMHCLLLLTHPGAALAPQQEAGTVHQPRVFPPGPTGRSLSKHPGAQGRRVERKQACRTLPGPVPAPHSPRGCIGSTKKRSLRANAFLGSVSRNQGCVLISSTDRRCEGSCSQ